MPWTYDLTAWILRLISNKKPYVPKEEEVYFKEIFATTAVYFAKFGNKVDFADKTVLDVGCHTGASCFYLAFNGAARVVGTDINEEAINFAKQKLAEYPSLVNVVSFCILRDLPREQFDIVMSKESFEHYSNPESMMDAMKQHLKPKGIIVVGFEPLWKSPYGGHISAFSRLPWIHLLFPEPILMQELRRYFKNQRITSFEEMGLNKMTCERFLRIIKDNELETDFIEVNLAYSPLGKCLARIFKVLSLFSSIREYFSVNLYCILRAKPIKGKPA
jgi:SAM-dependent methyltransferase